MLDLTASHRNDPTPARRADLPHRKSITTASGLCVDTTKVVGNRAEGGRLSAEAFQLGVMPVAGCLTLQYRLRKKSLAPERNEPACIEVFRMQRPEAHVQAGSLLRSAAQHGRKLRDALARGVRGHDLWRRGPTA